MPFYTYQCVYCGAEWEEIRSFAGSEISEGRCPSCPYDQEDGGPIFGVKVPSQVSVKLSGPGFTPQFYPNRKGKL